MSELHKEPWEKEYLKKADEFEEVCKKRDDLGFEYDLEGNYRVTDQAIKLLRSVSTYSKIILSVFVLIILIDHYSNSNSNIIIKKDGGVFERITPIQVK